MKTVVGFLVVMVAVALSCAADDEGHHHEDLSAGQLGTVHFALSCEAGVEKPFERGVALLHSFWYEEVEKQFGEIAKTDPKCAMAHWGMAMGMWHQLWNHPDEKTIGRGMAEVKKARALHAATARERDYIAAIGAFYEGGDKTDHEARATAYSNAMEGVYRRYPEDREAAAFYALSLLASEPEHDTTFANRKKAAAILETLFLEMPDHPGVAHYLIHSYDKPQLAQLGLPAARRYAAIAPSSPHALHMPSHIFARLGLWQDDIRSNLASIAATRKTAAMHMGGEGHQFHAMDFLVYAYLQSGREAEAEGVLEEVRAMPAKQDMYGIGSDPRLTSLAGFPADMAMELHHWGEAAKLEPVPGAAAEDRANTYWARAIGAARSGDRAGARENIAELDAIHKELVAGKKDEWTDGVENFRQEAMAWANHAESKDAEATKILRALAEKEEATGEEPGGGIPAREMLADMLAEMKQPENALTEYEADLKFNPNRFDGLYGAAQAAKMAGKKDKEDNYFAQLVKSCDGAGSSRPELAQAKQLLAQK